MKRFILSIVLLAAGLGFVSAQSLTDNPYYRKSLELRSLATQSFDNGDYDAAADFANKAQEQAGLSDKYVEKMLAMTAANSSIKTAKARQTKADQAKAPSLRPTEYAAAVALLSDAVSSYNKEDFLPAKEKADQATAAFDSLARLMLADYNAKQAEKDAADKAIAAAKERMAWANSINAAANYPKECELAGAELATALDSYGKEDYAAAKSHAEAVLAALANISDKLPLPAVYTVRSFPVKTDCLWRIAAYPFIYNNPLKWPVIYEANKATFRDPSNPNLIYPGQKLKIPSIAGETRIGTYDPAKTYTEMEKPAKK
jgi:nucleoid-associated protein YgaU